MDWLSPFGVKVGVKNDKEVTQHRTMIPLSLLEYLFYYGWKERRTIVYVADSPACNFIGCRLLKWGSTSSNFNKMKGSAAPNWK
jgi:hypothetical protein